MQTYNNELVKSLEELKSRRAALQQQIEAESLEKQKLEAEKARQEIVCEKKLPTFYECRLEDRLDVVNGGLEEKMATGRDYDRVIQEAEQVGLILCQCDTQSRDKSPQSIRLISPTFSPHLIL